MDRITRQLMSDFLASQEIDDVDDSEAFEKFCNYTILSNEYSKTFDVNSITVGSGSDTGIDGIAIIVNGNLVEDVDEIDDLLEKNGYLEVTYVFVQAKTSSSFDTKDMGGFYFGVNDFFEECHKLPRNEEISQAALLSDHILGKASDFKQNPKCKTYYITTGVLNNDPNINAVLATARDSLEKHGLFESIETALMGANELGKLYRKTKNPISSTFVFSNKITLPDVDGIDQSYYGVLPFLEFRKMLIDSNDVIHNIFDDNVRDFHGANNPVNKSISETLTSEHPHLFSVLNNGVTIVASSIKTSGNRFTVSDYQIVNGCQTSNVLYEHRNFHGIDSVNIPVRLIVTGDEDVKSRITVSTNNQTAIKKEQLAAMSDFQRNLESYYGSFGGKDRLYYERRTKQYESDKNVVKRKIITISTQIKSFSAMFNKNPHMVSSFFGRLVKNLGKPGSHIFEANHQYAPYYVAGLAFYKLDSLFNSGNVDKKYKKVKFHLLMLVPLIASEKDLPALNSQRKAEAFCAPIIEKLNNHSTCKRIFDHATQIIDKSNADLEDKQALKSRALTDQVLNAYDGKKI